MNKKRLGIFTGSSLLLLVIVCLLSFAIGQRTIAFSQIVDYCLGREVEPLIASILQKRLIRTLLGLLAGSALGASGALMQSITRNPIADPSILGVNTGASLAVVAGIAFFGIHLPWQYILFALVGCGITVLLVIGIASFRAGAAGAADPIKLALAGAAISTLCASLISAIMLPRTNVMQTFRFWQIGSIAGSTMESILSVLPLYVLGLVLAVTQIHSLNILALGEETATGLGVHVTRTRLLGSAAAVLLCGATTAVAGPIAFVGLMIPHLVRLFVTADLRYQLPLSCLNGAILLLLADVIGRMIGNPGEMEVGIITAIIGAPCFILIVRKVRT